jgi:hypothetical protein
MDGNVPGFFDHEYPTLNNPPNLGMDQVIDAYGYDNRQTQPLPSFGILADGSNGINFQVAANTPILAAAAGTVSFRGQVPGYCELTQQVESANVIKITHANGYVTEYWHLSSFAPGLTVGTAVTRDPAHPVGYAGDSGCTSGPGLHFIVRNQAGVAVDPYGWAPLASAALYHSVDPWQIYNADNGDIDAASQYLWLQPLGAFTITTPSTNTVLLAPSGDITFTLSGDFYTDTLRLEWYETLQPASIYGHRSLRTFTFFGFSSEDQPLTQLFTEVAIDLAGPDASEISSFALGEPFTPVLLVWDAQLLAWVDLPTTWDPLTGHVHATGTRIGSFALTIPINMLFLPLVNRP